LIASIFVTYSFGKPYLGFYREKDKDNNQSSVKLGANPIIGNLVFKKA